MTAMQTFFIIAQPQPLLVAVNHYFVILHALPKK
jgi:hypothetical protein